MEDDPIVAVSDKKFKESTFLWRGGVSGLGCLQLCLLWWKYPRGQSHHPAVGQLLDDHLLTHAGSELEVTVMNRFLPVMGTRLLKPSNTILLIVMCSTEVSKDPSPPPISIEEENLKQTKQ